ncbi:hypothetical protein [Nocardia sp. NPDC051570]|uniref:hypothetical protein n=1 Tax=Nocardia sp. NPDC051570 TaxID=3364324 RepID=UPI00378FBE43
MTRDQAGRLIGGVFGLVFIEVNAGALPLIIGVALRVLAIAVFLGLLVVLRRTRVLRPPVSVSGTNFGRRYWIVVAIEAVVGLAGIAVINGLLHTPRATVAWIALVVGLHFFGLATVWRQPAFRWLGTAMAACGAVGLILATYGCSETTIAAIAGVAPGTLLLGSTWWGIHRADGRATP